MEIDMSDASRRPSADQVVVPARRGEKSERFQATPDEDVVPGGGSWVKSDQSWRKVDFSHLRRRTVSPLAGENSSSAKLKEVDIPVIRGLFDSGLTAKSIAQRYGVGCQCIKQVVRGETWKHIPGVVSGYKPQSYVRVGSENPSSKLKESDVQEIRSLYGKGLTSREIGGRFGVTGATIKYIIKNKTWKHVPEYGNKVFPRKPGSRGKLNAASVADIRRRVASGEPQAAVAVSCGVCLMTVNQIVRRKTWKHVP